MLKLKYDKTIKNIMTFLFIFTIISLFGALKTWELVAESQNSAGGFSSVSTTWVFWLWLPTPILSIILGYKYKKKGIKCKKNIVAGYIVGILLLIYGSFWFIMPSYEADYSEINKYKDIIGVKLPSSGSLEKIKWDYNSDPDKTDYQTINVFYNKDDTASLEEGIKSNENWILSTEIKSQLNVLIPETFIKSDDTYFLIYNKTLDEYNSLPENSGNYEIYAMRYSASLKMLEIDEFKYLYK